MWIWRMAVAKTGRRGGASNVLMPLQLCYSAGAREGGFDLTLTSFDSTKRQAGPKGKMVTTNLVCSLRLSFIRVSVGNWLHHFCLLQPSKEPLWQYPISAWGLATSAAPVLCSSLRALLARQPFCLLRTPGVSKEVARDTVSKIQPQNFPEVSIWTDQGQYRKSLWKE